MKYAIIADIAGQFDALMKLVTNIPAGYEIILLGDLIDRGPDSRKVVQWAIDHNIKTCYGNHEDMMCDAQASPGGSYFRLWTRNGGGATIESYRGHSEQLEAHLKWFKSLPAIIKVPIEVGEYKELVLTHAPIHPNYSDYVLDSELNEDIRDYFQQERSIIWNRREPRKRNFLQISGHNSHWGYREFKEGADTFAYSIDQSQLGRLTCLLVPDMRVIEENYPGV